MEDWLLKLAASTFEILEDEDESWFVNQYFKDETGMMRRETVAYALSHTKARQIGKSLNQMSKEAQSVLDRIAMGV